MRATARTECGCCVARSLLGSAIVAIRPTIPWHFSVPEPPPLRRSDPTKAGPLDAAGRSDLADSVEGARRAQDFVGAPMKVTPGARLRRPGSPRPTLRDAAPPYEAQELSSALLGALRRLEGATAEGFSSREVMAEVNGPSLASGAEFMRSVLCMSAAELDAEIAASMAEPRAFLFTARAGRGFVLFRGDVFQEGYFRRSRVHGSPDDTKPATAKLSADQPWLQWDRDGRTFVLRTSGAQARILAGLPDRVTIYRGAGAAEAELVAKASSLARRALPGHHARRMHLAAQYQRLIAAPRDSVFTSVAEDVARGWARPALLSAELPRSALVELSRRGELYVGFEYEHAELAFVRGAAMDTFFSAAKVLEKVATRPPAGLVVDDPDADAPR